MICMATSTIRSINCGISHHHTHRHIHNPNHKHTPTSSYSRKQYQIQHALVPSKIVRRSVFIVGNVLHNGFALGRCMSSSGSNEKRPVCNVARITAFSDIPNPRAYNSWISDCADIIPIDTFRQINIINQSLYSKYNIEFAIVTCTSIDINRNNDLHQVATDLFNEWRIGDKLSNSGVLMLVVLNARRIELITGTGISQQILTNQWLYSMQQNDMVPPFKSAQYHQGILSGVKAIESRLYAFYDNTYVAPNATQQSNTAIIDFSKPVRQQSAIIQQTQKRQQDTDDSFIPALQLLSDPWYKRTPFQLFIAAVAGLFGLSYLQNTSTAPTCDKDDRKMIKIHEITQYTDCSQYVPPPSNFTQFSTSANTQSDRVRGVPSQSEKSIEFDQPLSTDNNSMNDMLDTSDACGMQSLLSAGEASELRLGSNVFGVYKCTSCNNIQTAPITSFKYNINNQYSHCSNCSYRTALTKSILISPATRISDGREQTTSRCLHCNYNKTQYTIIPRIIEPTYPQSNLDTTSTQSFGGGQSTGSGSSTSY